jgi:N-acetylglucosaminyl-diphospho-decaprenol L-rhamnosyltransferase
MHIVISIVSHAQASLVKNLLASLDAHVTSKEHNVTIIVTENTTLSDDFYCKFPMVQIRNLRRKGFGANHNSAFEYLDPDLFLIVNPDIEFIEPFNLDVLVKQMEASKTDVTSPIILSKDGSMEDYKRSDLTVKNLLKRKVLKITDTKLDWFAGMFLIVNGRNFRKLGGFDTRFFMYVEDCDFCNRALQIGCKLEDVTVTSVKHDARRESRKIFSKHLFWHLQSLIKYWLKKITG